ncbi:hypothetical protein L3V86_04975 [Thiotrichales bacterium 19S11-10]|nr:hypothetical protein [Thiotrichales bacterium 19S11-10]
MGGNTEIKTRGVSTQFRYNHDGESDQKKSGDFVEVRKRAGGLVYKDFIDQIAQRLPRETDASLINNAYSFLENHIKTPPIEGTRKLGLSKKLSRFQDDSEYFKEFSSIVVDSLRKINHLPKGSVFVSKISDVLFLMQKDLFDLRQNLFAYQTSYLEDEAALSNVYFVSISIIKMLIDNLHESNRNFVAIENLCDALSSAITYLLKNHYKEGTRVGLLSAIRDDLLVNIKSYVNYLSENKSFAAYLIELDESLDKSKKELEAFLLEVSQVTVSDLESANEEKHNERMLDLRYHDKQLNQFVSSDVEAYVTSKEIVETNKTQQRSRTASIKVLNPTSNTDDDGKFSSTFHSMSSQLNPIREEQNRLKEENENELTVVKGSSDVFSKKEEVTVKAKKLQWNPLIDKIYELRIRKELREKYHYQGEELEQAVSYLLEQFMQKLDKEWGYRHLFDRSERQQAGTFDQLKEQLAEKIGLQTKKQQDKQDKAFKALKLIDATQLLVNCIRRLTEGAGATWWFNHHYKKLEEVISFIEEANKRLLQFYEDGVIDKDLINNSQNMVRALNEEFEVARSHYQSISKQYIEKFKDQVEKISSSNNEMKTAMHDFNSALLTIAPLVDKESSIKSMTFNSIDIERPFGRDASEADRTLQVVETLHKVTNEQTARQTEEIANIRGQVFVQKQIAHKLKESNGELKLEVEKLEKSERRLRENISGLESNVSQLKEKIQIDAQEDITAYEKLAERISKRADSQKELVGKIIGSKQEIEKLSGQLGELAGQLEDTKNHQTVIDCMANAKASLKFLEGAESLAKDVQSWLEEDIKYIKEQIDRKSGSKDELNELLRTVEGLLEGNKDILNGLSHDIASLKGKIEGQSQIIQNLLDKIATLESTVKEKESQLQQQKIEIYNLQAEVEELKLKPKSLSKKNEESVMEMSHVTSPSKRPCNPFAQMGMIDQQSKVAGANDQFERFKTEGHHYIEKLRSEMDRPIVINRKRKNIKVDVITEMQTLIKYRPDLPKEKIYHQALTNLTEDGGRYYKKYNFFKLKYQFEKGTRAEKLLINHGLLESTKEHEMVA